MEQEDLNINGLIDKLQLNANKFVVEVTPWAIKYRKKIKVKISNSKRFMLSHLKNLL